jgi:hypothetical protein
MTQVIAVTPKMVELIVLGFVLQHAVDSLPDLNLLAVMGRYAPTIQTLQIVF